MISAFVCINAHAAWRIVFDRNCLKIVMANTASQKLIEEQHNQRVDTIAAKKQKVELYMVSMANILLLFLICSAIVLYPPSQTLSISP